MKREYLSQFAGQFCGAGIASPSPIQGIFQPYDTGFQRDDYPGVLAKPSGVGAEILVSYVRNLDHALYGFEVNQVAVFHFIIHSPDC